MANILSNCARGLLVGYQRRSAFKLVRQFACEVQTVINKQYNNSHDLSMFEEIEMLDFCDNQTLALGQDHWKDYDFEDLDAECCDENDQIQHSCLDGKTYNSVVQIYAEELDLNLYEARKFVDRVLNIKEFVFLKNYLFTVRNVLKIYKRQFTIDVLRKCPQLFSINYQNVLYRLALLKDCGFDNINHRHLTGFKIIEKQTESFLKSIRLLSPEISVKECLVNRASFLSEEKKLELRQRLDIENASLQELYREFLQVLRDEITFLGEKITFKTISSDLFEVLHNLGEEEKVLMKAAAIKPWCIAQIDPVNFCNILSVIPKTFDVDALHLIIKARAVRIHVDSLVHNLSLFKEHIPFLHETRSVHWRVYIAKDPVEVKERNLTFNRIFPTLKISPIDRFYLLSATEEQFHQVVNLLLEHGIDHFSKDVASSSMALLVDEALNMKINLTRQRHLSVLIQAKLKEMNISKECFNSILASHPLIHHASIERIERNINYFRSRGDISQEQLEKGLTICLYDRILIEDAFDAIKEWPDYEVWKNSSNYLQALLLIIEKNQNFDGSAILITNQANESNIPQSDIDNTLNLLS